MLQYIVILHSAFNKSTLIESLIEPFCYKFSEYNSSMKLFIINFGCFFFSCLLYILMKYESIRFFPDGEFFWVVSC